LADKTVSFLRRLLDHECAFFSLSAARPMEEEEEEEEEEAEEECQGMD
jgi:streptomycin 6-kinase